MFEIHPVKKVSVVIPVYNEQESLPELIRRTTTACESLGKEYEILLIDDGSSDNSAHMLVEASQAENSHIVSILLNRNYGQHSAIMAGFSHVTGDLIITLDADLQNPPEEIPRLVAKADEGYDVVGTVRQNRQDSWFRKTASKMINRLIQRTTGKAMGDYGCMLRASYWNRHYPPLNTVIFWKSPSAKTKPPVLVAERRMTVSLNGINRHPYCTTWYVPLPIRGRVPSAMLAIRNSPSGRRVFILMPAKHSRGA